MATLINTTNVKVTELQTAPDGGGSFSGNNYRFQLAARQGWNEGVLGANTYTGLYTWGYGFGSGGGNLDSIYGLTPPTSGTDPPLALGDWRGLQYYFDGSTFDIQFKFDNQLTAPPPLPPPAPPPFANDVNIDFVITDSSRNYSIAGGPNSPPNFMFTFGAPAGASQGLQQIGGFVPDVFPLPTDVYWIMRVTTDVMFFGGGSIDLEINGNPVLSAGLTGGVNDFDYTNGSAGLTNANGIELFFTIS
jgi:hypothetical protein